MATNAPAGRGPLQAKECRCLRKEAIGRGLPMEGAGDLRNGRGHTGGAPTVSTTHTVQYGKGHVWPLHRVGKGK